MKSLVPFVPVLLWTVLAAPTALGQSPRTPAKSGESSRDQAIEAFTEPYRDIDVAAAEMGVLMQLHVREGDRVTAGQLLAQLDDSVLLASLDIVKAEIESHGRLDSAQAELEMQADLLEKLETLRDRKHASLQEVARASTQKSVFAARVQAVREEGAVKSCELKRIERQLQQRRVVSPIDGVVTRVAKETGEFVSPSDPIVAKVVQLDPLAILFSVPLSLVGGMKAGDRVDVEVQTAGKLVGQIEFVSPTADVQSGTTRVRVTLSNPGEKIPCGVPCHLLPAAGTARLAAGR